jgi:hypothetical protein
MEATKDFIEPLLHKVEAYGKTSLKIVQLKTVEKTAVVTASLISLLLLIIVASFFVVAINISLALWLGELLGKAYYGFLMVSLFYAVVAIILVLLHTSIKRRISNFIITQLLN